MKAYFGRRYALSASHRLHAESLTADENRAAYGKCNNPHGHGHNYIVEVLIGGQVSAATGMVVNLVDLDSMVRTQVVERFDHTNLNLDPLFTHVVPTTENLCRTVFEILNRSLHAGRKDAPPGSTAPLELKLEYVRVEETENNFFQCFDAGAPAATA